jgi:ribonuclease VapC
VIVVDTSALVAIHFGEDDADVYATAIVRAERAIIGAATAFEFLLVTARKQGAGVTAEAEQLLRRQEFDIEAWTPDLVPVALDALRRFGGRPARLNFGDCLAYALAMARGLPLLYKGVDFSHTDVTNALS